MGAYHAEFYSATQAQSKTAGILRQPAAALKRIKLTYLELGSDTTADNQHHAQVKRTTANGTDGSTVIPTLSDPADGAASATVGQASSAEPTYSGGALVSAFFHQRSTFQWYAQPGHEVTIPVTNNAGLGVFMVAMSASANIGGMFEFEE